MTVAVTTPAAAAPVTPITPAAPVAAPVVAAAPVAAVVTPPVEGAAPAPTGAAVVVPAPVTAVASVALEAPAAAPAGAPDAYTLTLPDGPLDATDLEAFTAHARTKNWTNDQAQAALTEHTASIVAQSTRFLEEATAHGEIGGAQLPGAQLRARAVIDRFLPPDSVEGIQLRAGLDKTGYGNWTPLVLLLSRVGTAMGEDRPIGATTPAGARRSDADVLFGDARPPTS